MEEKWTEEEIKTYQRYRDNNTQTMLGPAYLSVGIPSNEPHKRVEYLKEKLKLIFTKEKYEKILEYEKTREKSDSLINLETLAIKSFF